MKDDIAERLLPAGTTAWVLASGKAGHEVNCLGIAEALGVAPEFRPVEPRAFFAALAPFGPIDPRDAPRHRAAALAPPFPDIALAAGRITVPYLRHLKRASRRRTFTVFLQDPRAGRGTADVIWVPEHDRLRGGNVIVTLTSPHPLRPAALAEARRQPDPRIARLGRPRVAMVLGGPSASHSFTERDIAALAGIAGTLARAGNSLMVTPSRRTPPGLVAAIAQALAAAGPADAAFVWDGSGANPYLPMLAHADAILVTGDSVNMVGEAVATGAPVHIYEPTGGNPKIGGFIDKLVAQGAARRWRGALEHWTYQPVDATAAIAREIAARYGLFRQNMPIS
jgi:mitochondrial fission protein ELM1